jgi:signal transduction histidine kinase
LRHSAAGGTVTIAVTPSTGSRQAGDADSLAVAVTDTGAGMTREETERIFARFYKGPGSRGAGLGLAIAHGLVLAHGGSIGVVSEPGCGTTITFTLPSGVEPAPD